MRAEDFSGWLSAIASLSVDQRRDALDGLSKADRAKTGAASEDLTGALPKRGGQAWSPRGRAWNDQP